MPIETKPQRILIPLDQSSRSEEAIPYALAIARPGDQVMLLHAVPLPDISPVLLPKAISIADLSRELHDAALRWLEEIASKVTFPDGVTVKTLIVDGAPADAIVHHSTPPETSLIVMTTAGRGAVGRLAYGSVADRVARTAPAPVLLVRGERDGAPSEPARVKRLIVPLDGSSRAERALPRAIDLAKRLEIPVLLVSVNEAERMAYVYGSAFSAAAYAEIALNAEQEIEAMLNGVAERLRAEGIETEARVLAGATAYAIESVTEPGDVIVMTSHGRSGVRRWILGSVAEQLVRNAPVPVLLVPSM